MRTSSTTVLPTASRSGRRRLLRVCAYIVAALLSLGLIGFGTLVAINWNDEELTPETQAWLTDPANPVPDAQNAWLAMLAIGFENQTPPTGRDVIEVLRQRQPTFAESGEISPLGAQWKTSDIDISLCSVYQKGPGILGRILENRHTAEALVKKHRQALQRYYAAIALPDYFEILEPALLTNLPITPSIKAACLARMDLSLRLTESDPSASRQLHDHLRYWLHANMRAKTLLTMLLSNAQVRADIDLLKSLNQIHTKEISVATQELIPELRKIASAAHRELLLNPLQGEFRYQSWEIEHQSHQIDPLNLFGLESSRLDLFATEHFYQPHASINMLQHFFANGLERGAINGAGMCYGISLSRLYNPLGKAYLCKALPNYAGYFAKQQQLQLEVRQFVASPTGN